MDQGIFSSVFYTEVVFMINPLIYGRWVKDVKMALVDAIMKFQRNVFYLEVEIRREVKELNFTVVFYMCDLYQFAISTL